jgi:hypothetical protein
MPCSTPPPTAWLQMRSKLVPVVSVASRWIQWVLLGGILLIVNSDRCTTACFRYRPLRHDHGLQHRYPAGGIRCQQPRPGMDDPARRGHQQRTRLSADALKWAARTYLVAAIGLHWHAALLCHDLHEPPGLSGGHHLTGAAGPVGWPLVFRAEVCQRRTPPSVVLGHRDNKGAPRSRPLYRRWDTTHTAGKPH